MDPNSYCNVHLRPLAGRSQSWPAISRYLQRWIPPDSEILDLGAGYCDFINTVRAKRKAAVDLASSIRQYASADVEVTIGPCHELGGFPDHSFDAVFASNLLEHLTRNELDMTLQGILRILRPSGHLLLMQPNFRYAYRYYFDDFTHRAVFSHVSLPAVLRLHRFETVHLEKRFLPYSHDCLRFAVPSWVVAIYLRLPYRPMAHQMLAVAKPIGSFEHHSGKP